MTVRKVVGVLLLSTLMLAGCGQRAQESVWDQAATTLVMECVDARFIARVQGEEVWLFLPGETRRLQRVEAASGNRYQDGELTLWLKGQEGSLQGALQNPRGCRNNPALAQWEHAKLSGVDFRAIGQEPPWILEIAGDEMRFWQGYERNEVALQVKDRDEVGHRTLYELASTGQSWTIELSPGPCRDSMSGETFGSKVTIDNGERQFLGCGNALH